MKSLFGVLIVCLFVSCGKYKKPFISFKSPEKRLTESTWLCIKAVDAEGNETEVIDRLNFSIDGSDSTFTRISNDPSLMGDLNAASAIDTVVLEWTWGYALNGNMNKQLIVQKTYPQKILRVISLSKKVLVLEDQSVDNTRYHYAPL